MVQACWRALQPTLAQVPIVTAAVLARLATPPRAEPPPPPAAPAAAAPAPCHQPPSSPAPPPPSGGSWASAQWAPLAPERAIAVAAA